MAKLLTRDHFREGVFARDGYRCVFCDAAAVDAHHLIERRLFEHGGYYLENGISVCEPHHRRCEATDISVEDGRRAAGISRIVVPEEWDTSLSYDKWGNVVLDNGARLPGPLLRQLSVQDVIRDHLDRFIELNSMHDIIKYPRTPHSLGSKLQGDDTSDGQIDITKLTPDDGLLVVEEKLDGGNSGISFNSDCDFILQSRGHSLSGGPREKHFAPFKAWAAIHQEMFFDKLGDRFITYGEWVFPKHTIFYDLLPHYWFEFDVFDKHTGKFLDTEARHRMWDGTPVVSVPVIHRGALRSRRAVQGLVQPSLYKSPDWRASLASAATRAGVDPEQALRETNLSDLSEGLYFKLEKDGHVVGRYKYVRQDFVQAIIESGSHWLYRPTIPNQLAPGVDIFG